MDKIYALNEIQAIVKPILQQYGVSRAYLFGSYACGEATGQSDIDLRIDGGKIKSMFGLGGNAGKDLLSIFLLKENMVLLLIAVIAATPVFHRLKNRLMAENAALAVCIEKICAALFLVASLGYTVTASYNPFLYMNF